MNVIKPREVSRIIEAGGVAAAVESVSGNIYVGVCIDTACTLGIYAERNGKAIPPCGACREFMTQLMPDSYRSTGRNYS